MKRHKGKNNSHSIYWITGQSGAGKTTLAYALQKKLRGIVLDGDEMRESISLGTGFSKKDREEHNMRVARLALILSKQIPVIVSVIAPFKDTRKKINTLIKPIWIYIESNFSKDPKRPYEIPQRSHITFRAEERVLDKKVKKIIDYIKEK